MRYILLFFLLLFLLCCKKDFDTLPPEVHFSTPDLDNGDTLLAPVATSINFSVHSNIKNVWFSWDFGDSTFSGIQNETHSYSSTGLYKVTVKAKTFGKEGQSSIYVKVMGQMIGHKTEKLSPFFLHQFNSDVFVIGTSISDRLLIQKFSDNKSVFLKQPVQFGSDDLTDIIIDRDHNISILQTTVFGKINLNGETLMNKYISNYFNKSHIQATADNNYLLIGRYNDEITYEKRNNNGDLLIRKKIYDNKTSSKHCLDATFINDNEYLLVFNEGDYYDAAYDKPNVSIAKRNLSNNNESSISVPGLYCENILPANDGVLLYGFEIPTTCGGCESYLDVAKISSSMQIEWMHRINIGDIHYDWDDFYGKAFLREYEDKYNLFYGNGMFSISKSGKLAAKAIFKNINFQVQAIFPSGENTLVAGIDKKLYYNSFTNDYAVLLKINKEGVIID